MKVEVYSDVVCPWCYIGQRRFRDALEMVERPSEIEIVHRPYQLDPAAPATAIPLIRYLDARYGPAAKEMRARVGEIAAGVGIDVDWDAALAANTFDAHRLLLLAERERGRAAQRALAEKLFEAHFTRGLDIGDRAVLAGLAEQVGLDPERARSMLASEEGVTDVRRAIADARERGIRAVPSFVFDGRHVVEGAQPADVLARVIRELREEGTEEVDVVSSS